MLHCNRIYYSKIYWRLNVFRAAYRSSSEAPNCICSLWFIYPCGDRSLSRLVGNWVSTHPGQYRHTAHHHELQTVFAASGLHTHVVTGRCQGWAGTLGGDPVPTQPAQRPVTTWVYKPEAANTVWSSWWWAVCRSKHVELSVNFGIINSITMLHLVGYFYWSS
jgi:hypothetical protein